jgi:hypothetical protein
LAERSSEYKFDNTTRPYHFKFTNNFPKSKQSSIAMGVEHTSREGISMADILPPGTVRLIDITGQQTSKHAEGKGQQDIILVPHPSENPEDPLNWTFKRKLLATSCIVVYTIAAAYPSSAVYSVVTPIRKGTSLTLTDINNGTGIMVCNISPLCEVVIVSLTLVNSSYFMVGVRKQRLQTNMKPKTLC